MFNFFIGHAGFAFLHVYRASTGRSGVQPSIRWRYRWHRGPFIRTDW